jgi:hypothetical protein
MGLDRMNAPTLYLMSKEDMMKQYPHLTKHQIKDRLYRMRNREKLSLRDKLKRQNRTLEQIEQIRIRDHLRNQKYSPISSQLKRRKTTEFNQKWRKEPCYLCNKFKNGPNPISWHHLNPNEKSFQISYSNCGGKSDEEIQTEINKCIPLCNKCHTKIHGCMKKMVRLNKNLTALTVPPEQWGECGL